MSKVTMFYNAKPHMFEKAKALRDNMTKSEQKLWGLLRGKKVQGFRFRSQHPIDVFIADFYCHPLRMVIEVDGGIHKSRDQKEYDIGREEEMSRLGIFVIRFRNEDIENDIARVLNEIEYKCKMRSEEIQSPL